MSAATRGLTQPLLFSPESLEPAGLIGHLARLQMNAPSPPPVPVDASPMMAQYLAAKARQPDALLFFRMGDFYELFFEDAEVAAETLGITLTRRGKHQAGDIPMAGVPVHAVDGYLARLIRAGFKVAVCEQLEDPAEAKKRGAKIYAEVAGFGMSADAGHMTAPNMDGPRRAMRAALRNAGVNADQVGYVNAHGTSTPLGDLNESNAIKAALGEHARSVVVSSTKSMTGHLLGAAGGIEAVFSVLAIRDQVLPPTINFNTPDPACDLDYVPNIARETNVNIAMSNSFGFGGTNGTLIFKKI